MKRFHDGFKARLAAVLVMAAVALGLLQVAPANADDTNVTFTIAPGGLAIDNAQTDVTLSSTNSALGTTAAGSLGNITVTDTRNLSVGWIASGSTTDFTHSNGTNTISKLQATMTQASTLVTNTNVTLFVGAVATGAGGVLGTATAVGSNAGTFAPTISVLAPVGTVTGTYTGVFTSTVI